MENLNISLSHGLFKGVFGFAALTPVLGGTPGTS